MKIDTSVPIPQLAKAVPCLIGPTGVVRLLPDAQRFYSKQLSHMRMHPSQINTVEKLRVLHFLITDLEASIPFLPFSECQSLVPELQLVANNN